MIWRRATSMRLFLWGPIAGYFANRSDNKVRLVPFPAGQPIRFDYEISMGVRYGEKAWRDKVDNWIASNQPKIDQILSSYQVPLAAVAAGKRRNEAHMTGARFVHGFARAAAWMTVGAMCRRTRRFRAASAPGRRHHAGRTVCSSCSLI